MEKHVLFKTIHGSRLYGLAHADSDEDFYTVLDKVKTARAKYAKQTITDGEDSMVVDFGTWLGQCGNGVPQALEAMFSPVAIVDEISEFRAGYRVGTEAYARYLRTIKSFALEGSFKRKRHALRLALNLNELSHTGRFNPTLDAGTAKYISTVAKTCDAEDVYDMALQLAWGRN